MKCPKTLNIAQSLELKPQGGVLTSSWLSEFFISVHGQDRLVGRSDLPHTMTVVLVLCTGIVGTLLLKALAGSLGNHPVQHQRVKAP